MAAPMNAARVTLCLANSLRIVSVRHLLRYNRPKLYGGMDPVFPSDRSRHRHTPEEVVEAPTFAEIVKGLEAEQQRKERTPVDIGLSPSKHRLTDKSRPSDLEQIARHRQLKIPLDEVQSHWQQEYGPEHKKRIAEHYGIYRDLLENSYFYPVVDLQVFYDYDDDLVTPVFYGNMIPPAEAKSEPRVEFESDPDTLWTLVLTNPDGHLTDNDSEYLHWMIGNIPGGEVSQGDVLCDYLQPFPPQGTGFHRHAFVLFKQEKRLDFSPQKRSNNCTSLEERTFKLADFYGEYEDDLTAVGLCFFQSEHDDSVKAVYHHTLDMRMPSFEYQYPPFYHPPQKMYPKRQPFDRYYDRYRDTKDLAEEVMRMKMDIISPYNPYKPKYKYPCVHRSGNPSWLRRKENLIFRRLEQYKDLPKVSD